MHVWIIHFRTRLEAWNHIKLTDRAFSCLPTYKYTALLIFLHRKRAWKNLSLGTKNNDAI